MANSSYGISRFINLGGLIPRPTVLGVRWESVDLPLQSGVWLFT